MTLTLGQILIALTTPLKQLFSPLRLLEDWVERTIEEYKFDKEEKRDVREALLNAFSTARQGHWRRISEPNDLMHVHKQITKLRRFDEGLFHQLRRYIKLWTEFLSLSKTYVNTPAKQKKAVEEAEQQLSNLDDEICKKLTKFR